LSGIDVDGDTLARALSGDAGAVASIVRTLQRPFYGLARRMTLSNEDAEDATQEALVRVVTHLAQFDGASRFSTWAYRIAVNQILDAKKKRHRLPLLSVETIEEEIRAGLEPEAPERADDRLWLQELKTSCGIAMLATLDGEHRVAYVLGEILELSGEEAAEILEVDAATFRKRLSRARESVRATLERTCGIVEAKNPCRCHRRLARARTAGWLPAPVPGARALDLPELRDRLAGLREAERAAAFYRADGELEERRDFVASLRRILSSKPDAS